MTPEECRARRLALGATLRDLARRAGLVERTIERFEAGMVQPRPITLIALRRGFRVLEAESAEPAL